MIQLKKLYIEGFRSIDSLVFDFQYYKGITLIKGSNGSGKTTFIESLVWCLFGENLKGTNLDKIPTKKKYRLDTFRGTRVICELDIDGNSIVIARHHKFKGTTKKVSATDDLFIFENDKLISTELKKIDVQETIIKILGIDYKTFINSILFGQRMKKFIEASNEDKRILFEKLFDVDFVDDCLIKTKQKLLEANDLLSSNSNKITVNDATITQLRIRIEDYQKILNEFEKKKQLEIDEVNGKLLLKTDWLSTLNFRLDELEINEFDESRYNDLLASENKFLLAQNENKLKSLESDIEILEKEIKDGVCKSCGQKLDKVDTQQEDLKSIKKEKVSLKRLITRLSKKVLLEKDEFDKLSITKKNIDEQKENQTKLTNDIQVTDLQINSLTLDLERIRKSEPPKIDLKDLSNQIDGLLDDNKKIQEESAKVHLVQEKYEWWVKKGYSSTGLKSYVFNSMLNQLNILIEKYANRLGVRVRFSVDLEKARKSFVTECYKDSILIDYSELSGGEKSRIDIALAFSVHDLLSSSLVEFNLLFMDEFFENLDEEGLYEVFELLREKSKLTTIFVITHNQNLDMRNTKSIEFYKEDGLTRTV